MLQKSLLCCVSKDKMGFRDWGQSPNETETAVILQELPTASLAPGHQTLFGL
jgi:hypothetical protein